MRKSVLLISVLCISMSMFAQQGRLVDCPIEQLEDVSLWDKLIAEKLKLLYPDKEMFKNCSSITFEKAFRNVGVQLVDVRTQAEYDEGHIAGALLIDIRQDDFDTQIDKLLQPGKPVAVYCRGGVRSRRAAEKLLMKGFQVYNLDRGFSQWKEDGKPVEKP